MLANHVIGEAGLLVRLRPFAGVDPEHLHQLITRIDVLHAWALEGNAVPADALEHAISLIRYVQLWALDEDGMLRRNKPISDVDRERLREWSQTFGESLASLELSRN